MNVKSYRSPFPSASSEREENGTHLRKKALACLFRLNSRLMSGAQFTEEEVAALEAVEQRFEQRQQLNTIKDSDTTSIQRQDMTCILVLDGQHQVGVRHGFTSSAVKRFD